MSAPDPFGGQQAAPAADPFGGPAVDGGDPFSGPRKAGGGLSPTPEDLVGRLLMMKFLKTSEETSKFPSKDGSTTGTVFHVNLAVLDGGMITVTQQSEDYSTTVTELGEAPAVFLDSWIWQVGIQNSIHKNQTLTLGRLVRSPTKETQKTFPDRAALEALFTAQPHLIKDPKGPKWFWMLDDFTPADAEVARTWYRNNPAALDVQS